ncbi:MAG: hypothetical protein DRK00_03110 [Thermoprotei archaeon]|nr:MAG: hypothetical protein DRK00_03110 [Thermoprotei archaeon]
MRRDLAFRVVTYAAAQALTLAGMPAAAYVLLSAYSLPKLRSIRVSGPGGQVLLAFFAGLWPLSLALPLITLVGRWYFTAPSAPSIYTTLASSVVEELFFRGMCPNCLPWVLAFYAFHTPLAGLPESLAYQLPLIPLGYMLCRAYRRGGLASSISMHTSHNLLASLAQIDATPGNLALLLACYLASAAAYRIVTS